MRVVIGALAAFLLSHGSADAQTLRGWDIGVGAGVSALTNTPHRPLPKAGTAITGAGGPDKGVHIQVLAEKGTRLRWLHARGEAFWNRLDTDGETYNCYVTDRDRNPPRGDCYPAAGEDRAVGVAIGGRAQLVSSSIVPSIVLMVGAANYKLTPGPEFIGLDGSSSTRPVIKSGLLSELRLGKIRLQLEAALYASTGRGGGTNHVPVSVNILF